MEIREQDLPFAQLRALLRLRFLDLHHQFAACKDRGGIGLDGCTSRFIIAVRRTDAEPGTGFDPDVVAMRGQFAHALGREADAVFVVLDFPDSTDTHDRLLWLAAGARIHPVPRLVSPDWRLAGTGFGGISCQRVF